MTNNKSGFQKLSEILNASSETFMLIALVSLFAIPFVIGANIEPVVKTAESVADRPVRAIVRDMSTSTLAMTEESEESTTQVAPTTSGSVLGASTANNPFALSENTTNLEYFTVNKSEPKENFYDVQVSTNQLFGKISLLTLKNDSPETRTYRVSAVNLNEDKSEGKIVYLGKSEYEIATEDLSTTLSLNSGEELDLSIKNNQSRGTSFSLSIELVQ